MAVTVSASRLGFSFQAHLYLPRACTLVYCASIRALSHFQLHDVSSACRSPRFPRSGLTVLVVVRPGCHKGHTNVVSRKGDAVRSLPRSCLWLRPWRPSMWAIERLASSPNAARCQPGRIIMDRYQTLPGIGRNSPLSFSSRVELDPVCGMARMYAYRVRTHRDPELIVSRDRVLAEVLVLNERC